MLKVAPLRALITTAETKFLSAQLQWTTDAVMSFDSIKRESQSVPTLATPDYSKPFHLYVANRCDNYASAVLIQET